MKIKNLIIGVMFLILLASFVSAKELCCLDNPVSLWHFNTNLSNVAVDSCGENNGTIYGAVLSLGRYNNSLVFDGTDDYVKVIFKESLNITNEIAIGVWVYPTSVTSRDLVIKSGSYTLKLLKVTAYLQATGSIFSGGTEYTATSTTPLTLNDWHFIVMTFRNSYVYLYQDNVQEGQSTQCAFCKITANNNNVTIGGVTNYFIGKMDEVFIFNKSLNGTEITKFYEDVNCTENWIVNYTACNVSDNRIKYYTDVNCCGTFDDLPADNGTIVSCDYCSPIWQCVEFDTSCGVGVSEIHCLNVTYSNPECCNATGFPSDCNYSTIGNYSDFDMYCGIIDVTLIVPTYPYVDFNVSYPMALIVTQDNVTFNEPTFKINVTSPDGNTTTYTWVWDAVDGRYEKTFIFTKIGDYPFLIYASYPYDNIPKISGTLIVRQPFYVTFKCFETKNQQVKKYDNDFAYVIAEKTDKMYYDDILETFIVPLFFSLGYDTSVFHAPYIDGEATLKLWDNSTNYAVRIIDGRINFDSTYSLPEIVDSYGTNIYLGKFYWNGSQDELVKIYLEEKDTNQYRWLFNWIFIIALVLIVFSAIIMFFVIPEYSQLSIIFGLGFVSMLVVFRIALWIWLGW